MGGMLQSAAEQLSVLTNREEEWNLRMEMVRSAQRFLVLTTYYYGSDERSGQMADALIAAAIRGVRVVLVIDRFGQRLAQNLCSASDRPRLQKRLSALTAAGGIVAYYSPLSLRHQLVGGGLHVKIQASEAGTAIFGSSNIAHHSFSQWNEVALELRGNIVGQLVREACGFARLPENETAAIASCLPVPLPGAADASAPLSAGGPCPALWPLLPVRYRAQPADSCPGVAH